MVVKPIDGMAAVLQRVADACMVADRRLSEVSIVVVSKGRSISEIQNVYDAGQRVFAENRAQELAEKAPHLPGDIEWHFVGPLQRNKVRLVRPWVTLLHSLDRYSLGETWVKGPGQAPAALLEVNIGREPQKHGVMPEAAQDLVAELMAIGVDLQGVMAMPPQGVNPARHFEELVSIRDDLAQKWPVVKEVSAGMTEDLEAAISAGATLIRPGRAIFETSETG